MKFYYVNSKGKRINFYEYPFIMQDGNLLNYSYSYEVSEGSRQKLVNVKRGAGERSFKLALLPNIEIGLSLEERRNALKSFADELFETFETDTANNVNGALWTDTGCYLPCRIIASDKDNNGILNGLPFCFETFKAVSDKNAWIKPVTASFYPGNSADSQDGSTDYPYDYEYDYAGSKTGVGYFALDHYTNCDFEMVIYGPVVNPVININEHPYIVYTSVNSGEYLVINSENAEVYKVLNTGERISVYDLRGKDYSVFNKLPAGNLVISWNGSFGFDITAFVERSEPLWN